MRVGCGPSGIVFHALSRLFGNLELSAFGQRQQNPALVRAKPKAWSACAVHHDPAYSYPGGCHMKSKKRVMEDPVVEEVRRIRKAMWAKGGGTIQGYIRLIDRMEPPKKDRRDRRKKK